MPDAKPVYLLYLLAGSTSRAGLWGALSSRLHGDRGFVSCPASMKCEMRSTPI